MTRDWQEPGDACGRGGCAGTMDTRRTEACYCHISPPCGACTEAPLVCTECGADANDPIEEPMPKPDTMVGVFAGYPIHRDESLPPGHIAIVSGGKRTLFRLDLEAETATPVGEERWPLNATVVREVPGRPHVMVDAFDYGNAARFTYDNGRSGHEQLRSVCIIGPAFEVSCVPPWLVAHLLGKPLPMLP